MNYWKVFKLTLKIIIRFIKDIKTGDWFKLSRKLDNGTHFGHTISLSQKIIQNETYESKLYNFGLASQKINQYIIPPSSIFSFWDTIGNPNNQFKKGRTIQKGKIVEDVGGGLCQVSGIIYHVSLMAGLKIMERYNHSVDIYTEDTRFCPLGSDATVAYGYKDLRILNQYPFPIKFELEVKDKLLSIKLLSTQPIEEVALEFNIEQKADHTFVKTLNSSKDIISTSIYKHLQ